MRVVRTARAAASVHPSKVSCSGAAGALRWSMSQTESNPAASAASVRSSRVSKLIRNWGRNTPKRGRVPVTAGHVSVGSMETQGAVALVTGGASGIGRATVDLLRKGGAHVAVLDLHAHADQGDRAIECDVG